MNISEILTTDEIKVSAHSWTIKRNGKTAGVIRNITSISVMLTEQPRKAFDAFQVIKALENREAKISRASFYEKDGKYYYLYNIHGENFYQQQIAQFGEPLIPEEYERFMIRKRAVEELKAKVIVISAIVL